MRVGRCWKDLNPNHWPKSDQTSEFTENSFLVGLSKNFLYNLWEFIKMTQEDVKHWVKIEMKSFKQNKNVYLYL